LYVVLFLFFLSLGCPAGTYNDLEEQETCQECPEGFYCEANSTYFGAFACPLGHYCPNGTKYAVEYPCPEGSFNSATTARSAGDCILAPPGFFAQGTGNANPSGQCLLGYYCPRGATSSSPHCGAAYCSSGGKCYPGVQCPAGTEEPILCAGGLYCADSSGLATGECLQGHYCVQVCTDLCVVLCCVVFLSYTYVYIYLQCDYTIIF
jgi:hypothetical protein